MDGVQLVGQAEAEVLDKAALPRSLGDGVGEVPRGAGCLHDGLGDFPGAGQQAVGGEHLVDQAKAEGLPGADGLAGVEVVGGALGADELLEGELLPVARGGAGQQVRVDDGADSRLVSCA